MNLQQLEAAIRDYYGDTSRPLRETRDNLEEIRDLCDEMVEALNADLDE